MAMEGRRRRLNINVKAVVPEFGIHYCIRHQGVQFVLRQKSDDNTAQLLYIFAIKSSDAIADDCHQGLQSAEAMACSRDSDCGLNSMVCRYVRSDK